MLNKRVLITGATGFIGSRLCEVLSLTGAFEPRAFIHSTASAARITRFDMNFSVGDLCDARSVDTAIQGCETVVHLARGDARVMRKGLENILRASVNHGVKCFVHMSSVAVYGNNPPSESVCETARAKRTELEYGNEKLAQEHRVLHYAKRYGLPIVILRPPNVYGPFSGFTIGLINKIRSGVMAIVDGGKTPCNLVYIDNLIQAILLSLWSPKAIGETFFVTDHETITWEQCLEDHAKLVAVSLPRVSRADLVRIPQERMIRDSLRMTPRILLSGELRSMLRQIPVVRLLEMFLYNGFQSLSLNTRQTIRFCVNGPISFARDGSTKGHFDASDNLIAAQFRTVAHSNQKARRLLGYTAPISYLEGMALTKAWLRYSRII